MGAIGSFFGRLFASPKTIDNAIDTIKNAGDALILTKEERVQYNLKAVEMFIEFLKVANDGGHLARRIIGIMVALVWFIYSMTALVIMNFSIISTIAEPFNAVMIFYFGAGIITRLNIGKKE